MFAFGKGGDTVAQRGTLYLGMVLRSNSREGVRGWLEGIKTLERILRSFRVAGLQG